MLKVDSLTEVNKSSCAYCREKVPPRPQGQRSEPDNGNVSTLCTLSAGCFLHNVQQEVYQWHCGLTCNIPDGSTAI